jgi:16S rRNA (cytosine1402-N4)-methyltransferase
MTYHVPVLLNETIEYLNPQPGDIVVDGTLGGAGHSLALAEKIGSKGTLIGLDLDPASLKEAEIKFSAHSLKTKRHFIQSNYKFIDSVLEGLGLSAVDRILVDIGISSYDLDQSGRGFSFQKDEPLDMRYDPTEAPEHKKKEPFTARFILATYSEKELSEIFQKYSEEKFSKKIARAIVQTRTELPLETTTDLFNLIKKSLPAAVRFKAADSVRRVFQALRIEVNKELDNLRDFLPKAYNALKPGGRLAVISFHSLEDRIVKQYFNDLAKGCVCPPEFPKCICGKQPKVKILTKKPVTASEAELEKNSRSAPAKLRVMEKC